VSSAAAQPDVPAAAAAVFGDRLPLAVRYVELLGAVAMERGLLGPREAPRLWEHHVLGGAAIGELVAPAARVADVGSGAGLPGIPLALARPDVRMTLVEPMQRRVDFLALVRDELGIALDIVRARAEAPDGPAVDTVVARAVAPLHRLVPLVLPLLPGGGVVLAVKGQAVEAEITDAAPVLQHHGLPTPVVRTVGAPPYAATVAVIEVPARTDGASPRRHRARA
jgi:16S rRNA (guanine527-N7)-methyltransferase